MKKKETIFKWLFVVKNPKLNSVSNSFDFSTYHWYSDAQHEGEDFYLIGTEIESNNFYKELIENGYSVQDDYNLGEYKKK